MQSVAYGVSITTSKPKSTDERDKVNFGAVIKTTRYYQHRDRTTQQHHLASLMLRPVAEQVAARLAAPNTEVQVVELIASNQDTVYTSLQELGETSSLVDLEVAIKICRKEHTPAEIVAAVQTILGETK